MSGVVTVFGYRGEPGAPRDPATPGGYCLARCLCGRCPQHAAQVAATDALRRAEYERRLATEHDREEARRRRRRAA